MNLKPHIPLIVSTSIISFLQIISMDNAATAVNHRKEGFEVKKVILEDHDYFVSFGYGGYASVTHCGSCTNRVHEPTVMPNIFSPQPPYKAKPTNGIIFDLHGN